jgi:hypothetical protein
MYASLIYIYARQEAYHPLVGGVPSGGGGPPQGVHVPPESTYYWLAAFRLGLVPCLLAKP